MATRLPLRLRVTNKFDDEVVLESKTQVELTAVTEETLTPVYELQANPYQNRAADFTAKANAIAAAEHQQQHVATATGAGSSHDDDGAASVTSSAESSSEQGQAARVKLGAHRLGRSASPKRVSASPQPRPRRSPAPPPAADHL